MYQEVFLLQIKIIDRETGKQEMEKVAGEKYLKWIYTSPVGMSLLELIFKRKLFSFLFGKLQDTKYSKKRIERFIKEYEIDMRDYLKTSDEFKTFNEFFVRELREGSRPIDNRKDRLVSPGDGRLLAYEMIDINSLVQVKGITYSLAELIGNKKLAQDFQGGSCVLLRLCPTDYHRFHFPDEGVPGTVQEIKGSYYSVNPLALANKAQIYCQNKRSFTVFKSSNFDDILYLEIGATCVGSIVQTFKAREKVKKGEEKGFFKFGGSTVILFLKPGIVKLDKDLLENTKNKFETRVKLGMGIGSKVKSTEN